MAWDRVAMEVISARGLTKRFREKTAVDAVDLSVGRGEIFGLVGPNGAGKTTLVQLLVALLDPTAGGAAVLGFDVVREAPALQQRIGYVSQEFTLYAALSVQENLDFFADLYGVPAGVREGRKEKLLAWSRLAPFRGRRAGRLSGGMQKKLHLCCTLIHEPDVLFLDEPTNGVDPVSRRELWENLYDLVAEGLTLLVTTPYMDEAEQCHRVALMYRGKILRCETPERLKAGVADAVWELRTPGLPQVQTILRGARLPIQSHRMGDRLHILAPRAVNVVTELRDLLAVGEDADLHLRPVSPTMEDVFISVVTGAETERGLAQRSDRVPPRRVMTGGDGTVVRLEGLTKTFGGFIAVDNVSLSVRQGEVFGFLGPNGSGKTTTIRMLCGLLGPSAGRAEVLGQDVSRQGRRIKSRIGYMSQRFSLYDELTVGENLAFFGRGYGLAAQRLAERTAWVLEMARLRGEERRLARELSGGVKQRLALGCAILHEPEIVFLDEPTAGVDPIARREFWDLIGQLASQGTTIFVTTHCLDEAENCHRLALIYQGRLVALGSPQTLKEGMRAGVMLELECQEPFVALRLLRSKSFVERTNLSGSRLHVLVRDPAEAEPKIREALNGKALSVQRLEPIPFSLEDLFVIFIDMEEERRRASSG